MSSETLIQAASLTFIVLFIIIYGGLIAGHSLYKLIKGFVDDYKYFKSIKKEKR